MQRQSAKSTASVPPEKQFLDPGSCHELLGGLPYGKIASLPVSLLYFQLDSFLRHAEETYAPNVGTIPRRLREHNLTGARSWATSEMLPIDADVVFQYDACSKKSDITFKAYFEHPEFERPVEQRRVVLHVLVLETDGLKRSVSMPLQALMVGWGDVTQGHQGYAHSLAFSNEDKRYSEEWVYIGITSRNWLERMEEHIQEMRSGSNKPFHAAWRNYANNRRVMLHSELVVLNHSFDGIMAWEEEQVDIHMAAGRSLNMIPGGFKGLRFLHEHRLIPSINISLEERENALLDYTRRSGVRAGIPNPVLAMLWRDDAFYMKVLAGRGDVLTPAQVMAIRKLAAEGKDEGLIVAIAGARNVYQVRRLLSGKTYNRII